MQNRDIEFTADGKAILSRETYEEVRMFCRMHGETDLPPFWLPLSHSLIPNMLVEYPKPSKEVKKLTDE